MSALKTITMDEWHAEAVRLFGPDPMGWLFECPICHHVASVADWKAAGATEGEVAFSCVGRHTKNPRKAFEAGEPKPGPCNYAGGGLFRMNPQPVIDEDGKIVNVFAFASVATKKEEA